MYLSYTCHVWFTLLKHVHCPFKTICIELVLPQLFLRFYLTYILFQLFHIFPNIRLFHEKLLSWVFIYIIILASVAWVNHFNSKFLAKSTVGKARICKYQAINELAKIRVQFYRNRCNRRLWATGRWMAATHHQHLRKFRTLATFCRRK